MSFISLKWKLSLGFLLIAVGFIALYAVMAKRTFEADKIAYVFASQKQTVEMLASTFKSHVEGAIVGAQAVVTTTGNAAHTQKLFWEQPQLLAVDASLVHQTRTVISVEKVPGLLQRLDGLVPSGDETLVQSLDEDRFAAARIVSDGHGGDLVMRVAFSGHGLLGAEQAGQSLMLVAGDSILKRNDDSGPDTATVQELMQTFKRSGEDAGELTEIQELHGTPYLITLIAMPFGHLHALSLVNQNVALGALDTLFARSLLFLVFAFFATLIIAMLFTNGLTQNLNSLSRALADMSEGNFAWRPTFRSNDEIGALAAGIGRLNEQIQSLAVGVASKTRGESAQQTARWVQAQLFPTRDFYKNSGVRLFGWHKSGEQYQGEWWFYYQKDSELYVVICETSGQGLPAAMLTATHRSVFSLLQNSSRALKDIALNWDRAVSDAGQGKTHVAALLLQINVEFGECRLINAGHEPLLHLKKQSAGLVAEPIVASKNFMFGENKGVWQEDLLQLESGDRLLLFNKSLLTATEIGGDKRLLSFLQDSIGNDLGPDSLVGKIQELTTDLSETTLIAVDFKAGGFGR